MNLAQFDYVLPKTLIAQVPLPRRDASRLLVLHRRDGRIEHRRFHDLPEYLKREDALVLNDTKVKRARLLGRRETGGKIEVLLLRKVSSSAYEVLLSPSRRLKPGSPLFFGPRLSAEVVGGGGTVKIIRFRKKGIESWVRRKGAVPLPPYIRRLPEKVDLLRYQTVYARNPGAVAAPTAGLHFTKGSLQKLIRQGVRPCRVTLHVGYGTFEPVRSVTLSEHKMHKEFFSVSAHSADLLNKVRKRGGRIIAVGTTSCRALETSVQRTGYRVQGIGYKVQKSSFIPSTLHPAPYLFRPMKGWTDLFIYPPYHFRGTDALITNFHLPKTTLLLLVSAFAGRALTRKAYEEAVRERYRFYSYGDAMLIL